METATRALENLDVLIAGQLVTSRTETVEEYLVSRTRTLAVIGINGAFAAESVGRCTLYERGNRVRQWKLPTFRLRNYAWYKQPLLLFVFFSWLAAILFGVVRLNRRFDIFIGISIFSAALGVILKRAGIVRRTIYYCLDYYPQPTRWNFNRLLTFVFRRLDRWCAQLSDNVWNLSPRIAEARAEFGELPPDQYRHVVVPLGYSSRLLCVRPFEQIERWTIGFVGTLTENQGLQLLVEALPTLVAQLPAVNVRIVGDGPYAAEVRRLIEQSGQSDRFILHGFVRDEEEVFRIISRCAVGIAPWTMSADDYSRFADPGKPKLYAFCGLPIVITNSPLIASEIAARKAGIAIAYDKQELAEAIGRILEDDATLIEYRKNAIEFARAFTSEGLFDRAFENIRVTSSHREKAEAR